MVRHKKTITEKSSFKLRRRPLSDGRFSLFLDHYSEGKHKYDFLKLYLLPDNSETNRRINRKTLKIAYKEIRKRTEQEIIRQIKLQDNDLLSNLSLSSFIDDLINEYKKQGKKGYRHLITSKSNIQKFNPEILLKDIDRDFCRAYTHWLQFECVSSRGKKLAPMTAHIYSRKLRLILENAVKKGYLEKNPWNLLDRLEKIPEPDRIQRFLTHEEVKLLETTPYNKYPLIKSAFLFACFSGLRISDVLKLQWNDIDYQQNRFFLNIVMKKTGKNLSVPLSEKALDYLPYRIGESNRVFDGLPGESQIQKHLKRFCEMAGVRGRAHFHMSRHTFATIMLTAGVDIYTASKMMGHSDIRSTQTYAKIIDSKKVEAVKLIDNLM